MNPTRDPTPTHRRAALRQLLALAVPVLLPLSALAHGDAHHMATGSELEREQKPWGIAAAPAEATRRIDIRMSDDMRFTPSLIDVREGETVRLRIANRGKVVHELVLGTREELQAHAEMMKKHPGMQHDGSNMVHVPPHQRGDTTWTFNRPRDFEFACLIPGHSEAGMRGTLRVIPKP